MKELQEIYNELEKYNVPIINVNFAKKKAGIVSNGVDTVIAVDYSKIKNSKEEKRILAEEKAHYETGTLYPFDADKTIIDKLEYKANKRVYNELVPYEELKAMCEQGLSIAELSDFFGVPIPDITAAQFLYSNIENYKED